MPRGKKPINSHHVRRSQEGEEEEAEGDTFAFANGCGVHRNGYIQVEEGKFMNMTMDQSWNESGRVLCYFQRQTDTLWTRQICLHKAAHESITELHARARQTTDLRSYLGAYPRVLTKGGWLRLVRAAVAFRKATTRAVGKVRLNSLKLSSKRLLAPISPPPHSLD